MARWLHQRSAFSVTAASGLAVAVFLIGPLLVGQLPNQRFLVWNLALAWIPYVAALGLDLLDRARRPLAALAAATVWLLFLPNAPNLVTTSPTSTGRRTLRGWSSLASSPSPGPAACSPSRRCASSIASSPVAVAGSRAGPQSSPQRV